MAMFTLRGARQRVGCNASRTSAHAVFERLRGEGDAYQVSFLITIL